MFSKKLRKNQKISKIFDFLQSSVDIPQIQIIILKDVHYYLKEIQK